MNATRLQAASAVIAAALFYRLAVVTMRGSLAGFDEMIRMHAHALTAPWLTASALKLTWLGTLGVLALFGGVAAAILVRAGRRADANLLVFIMAGSLVLENALKFAIQRPRPPAFFGTDPTTYSFPSGHALFSLCFYGWLAVVLCRAGISRAIVWPITIALVAGIGATRVYLGVHYPTDVIAGYLIATAWLCAVFAWKAHRSRPPAAVQL